VSWRWGAVVVIAAALVAACGPAPSRTTRGGRGGAAAPVPIDKRVGAVQRGQATWYGGRFHGKPTASGEPFDQNAMTAAHRTLPMDTWVRVTNVNNGRTVEVRINDRGPYSKGRIIDLSRAAAVRLDMIRAGVIPVTVEVLRLGEKKKRRGR
jgi:rare lipoprotein A